ncbi:MAG: MotA/TolQ/ExbB proton channel family protein [Planctomycetota bacterium]|nr:MotA/TolQ/ExbB proton channel family protein [Planctomycetota bacterium]
MSGATAVCPAMDRRRLLLPAAAAPILSLVLSCAAGPAPAQDGMGEGALEGPAGLKSPSTPIQPPTIAGGTLWDIFRRGGPVMWPIAVCSVVGLAFVLERFIELRRSKHMPPGFVEDCAHIVEARGADAGAAFCAGKPIGIARVMHAMLARSGPDRSAAAAGIREETDRLAYDLRRNCRVLGVIANLAPLLGLLGTVTGMIRCFDVVAAAGTGKSHALASGIAEALLTTAFGLTVGIPMYFFYHHFRTRADDLAREIEEAVSNFAAELERKARYSMRLIGGPEDELETKTMPPAERRPADIADEFTGDVEENAKTAVPVGGAAGAAGPGVPVQIPNPPEYSRAIAPGELDEELKGTGGDRMVDTRAVTIEAKADGPSCVDGEKGDAGGKGAVGAGVGGEPGKGADAGKSAGAGKDGAGDGGGVGRRESAGGKDREARPCGDGL